MTPMMPVEHGMLNALIFKRQHPMFNFGGPAWQPGRNPLIVFHNLYPLLLFSPP